MGLERPQNENEQAELTEKMQLLEQEITRQEEEADSVGFLPESIIAEMLTHAAKGRTA